MLPLGRIIVLQIRLYRLVLLKEERKVRDEILDDIHFTAENSHERNWAKYQGRERVAHCEGEGKFLCSLTRCGRSDIGKPEC